MKKEWIMAFGHLFAQINEVKGNIRQFGNDSEPIIKDLEKVEESLLRLYDEKIEEWKQFEA